MPQSSITLPLSVWQLFCECILKHWRRPVLETIQHKHQSWRHPQSKGVIPEFSIGVIPEFFYRGERIFEVFKTLFPIIAFGNDNHFKVLNSYPLYSLESFSLRV
jgi:hypothetical protein